MRIVHVASAFFAVLLAGRAAVAAPMTFVVNDALVKDRMLEQVTVAVSAEPGGEPVARGTTGADGQWQADLDPGTWHVAYLRPGYIALRATEVEVPEAGGQVTTSLVPLLEVPEESKARTVRVVLNWGSDWDDVPDADAHLVCACPESAEVYFADRDHLHASHEVHLDVDDIDWGGPETITLESPPPGRYRYFVRNYSGTNWVLGDSGVVVRVLVGDRVVGEYRPPAHLDSEDWFPFAALVVDAGGAARVQEFTDDQLAAGDHRRSSTSWGLGCSAGMVTWVAVFAILGVGLLAALARMRDRWNRPR